MSPHHLQPDRRSPMVLDVHELRRRPGEMREIRRKIPAPADFGIAVIGVPQDSELDLDARLEAVVEGILVSGVVSATLEGECARCLEPLDWEEAFEVQELYFYPGNEVGEDESVVVDDSIDLEEALRDAVVLNLPFTPLCEDDCLGLCPECGTNLNQNPEHNHGERVDPRWGKLAELDPRND